MSDTKYILVSSQSWGLNATEFTCIKDIMEAVIELAFDDAADSPFEREEGLRDLHTHITSFVDINLRAHKISKQPRSDCDA